MNSRVRSGDLETGLSSSAGTVGAKTNISLPLYLCQYPRPLILLFLIRFNHFTPSKKSAL